MTKYTTKSLYEKMIVYLSDLMQYTTYVPFLREIAVDTFSEICEVGVIIFHLTVIGLFF